MDNCDSGVGGWLVVIISVDCSVCREKANYAAIENQSNDWQAANDHESDASTSSCDDNCASSWIVIIAVATIIGRSVVIAVGGRRVVGGWSCICIRVSVSGWLVRGVGV